MMPKFACKRCFYLFICNELFCIDQENQLLIITNTMNIIAILDSSIFNVFLYGYFLQCIYENFVVISLNVYAIIGVIYAMNSS